jgi:16S rRNA (adenine1518-N6/adenine1519-N6)-dimethyltransferase
MSLLEQTKNLCTKYYITPSRSKGQNFLIDEKAYEAMITAAQLSGDETVLEVGPGLGFLTEKLSQHAQKVIAVELDDRLATVLKKINKEKKISNVEIYNQDILNFSESWTTAVRDNTKLSVVANLPYNISSFFLRKFIAGNEGNIIPQRLTLMLQKEVGERLVAIPGQMSLLAISVQFYATVNLVSLVPAISFWPAPKVGSAIVTFDRINDNLEILKSRDISEKYFFRIVKIGFSARRKMLKANLASGLRLPVSTVLKTFQQVNIKEKVRAQELSLSEWLKLIAAFKEIVV